MARTLNKPQQNNAELKPFIERDIKKNKRFVTVSPPFFPLMVGSYWIFVDLLNRYWRTFYTIYTCPESDVVLICVHVWHFQLFKILFSNWNQKEGQKTEWGRESMKNKDKKVEERGRIALTRQYPLLFPRSSASRLPLKQNYRGGGGIRRKRKEKSKKEDAWGKVHTRNILMRQCFK